MVGIFTAAADSNDSQGWLIVNSHISLDQGKKYQIYLEAQPRVGDNWRRAATFQGRAAVVYNIDKSIGIYAGYAWTPNLLDVQYHRDYRDEQRLWQQFVHRFELFGLNWQQRLRQEQRFITRSEGVSSRSRYLLRSSYPLNDQGDLGLTAFDEVMVNLNGVKNGPWGGYDRNRIFFGPYWQIENARYEVGYLGEHLKRFGNDERWTHALAIWASYNW